MQAIHLRSSPLAERERNDRIYSGEIIVFRGFAAVAGLVERLRAHCVVALGADPERVHEHRSEAEVNTAAEQLRQNVMADREVAAALNEALAAVGVEVADTWGDGLKQRVQMAASRSGARMVSPLGAHRDTWGSNIMAQTNWWAPVYPVAPERTIALFPNWFDRPVSNDSAGWDFRELLRCMREQGPEPDYPLLPLASEPPPWADSLPVAPEPGDLMCFSGAHLHASVPNTTARTRLSCELRTVNGGDASAGRGAPNVDGRPVRTTWQLFKRLSDGEKLGAMA